jgi:hypothetical protein
MDNAKAYYENRIARLRSLRDYIAAAMDEADVFIDTEETMPVAVTDIDVAAHVKGELAKLHSAVIGDIEATRVMVEMSGGK